VVPGTGLLLDVAGGTGIVAEELAAGGFSVLVADRSAGMLRLADHRLPGRALRAAAERLPVRDASVDVVTMVWLLHLLPVPQADAALAEAARVMRPGGHLVTTVDKHLAHGTQPRSDADLADRVIAVAGRLGLRPSARASFTGTTRWASAEGGQVFRLACFRKPDGS
jgi:septum formation protein